MLIKNSLILSAFVLSSLLAFSGCGGAKKGRAPKAAAAEPASPSPTTPAVNAMDERLFGTWATTCQNLVKVGSFTSTLTFKADGTVTDEEVTYEKKDCAGSTIVESTKMIFGIPVEGATSDNFKITMTEITARTTNGARNESTGQFTFLSNTTATLKVLSVRNIGSGPETSNEGIDAVETMKLTKVETK